jgi:alcohol dehydrogenase
MAAAGYPRLLADVAAGLLDPAQFITRTITLADTPAALAQMSTGTEPGITIIRP